MNELTGLQAICVALAQPEASFNFNPLIQSPRRSIEPSLQRAVSELFGCWDESALQIESAPAPTPQPGNQILSAADLRSACTIVAATLAVLHRRCGCDRGWTLDCDRSHRRFQEQPAAATRCSRVKLSSRQLPRTVEVPKPPRRNCYQAESPSNRTQRREANKPETKSNTETVAERLRSRSRRPVDQGGDADRKWTRVESVDCKSQTRNGWLRSDGAANRAAATLSRDVELVVRP